MVVEGRDIGTVVAAGCHAEDLPHRGRRRAGPAPAPAERRCRGRRPRAAPTDAAASETADARHAPISRRSRWTCTAGTRKDSTRQHAPLQAAADAVVIDSSELAVEETVDRVLALAAERGIR